MVQSLQTESRLFRKEVGTLKQDTTTLTNNAQSTEVLLDTVQTSTKLLEKELVHLKENTNTLTDKTQLNEILHGLKLKLTWLHYPAYCLWEPPLHWLFLGVHSPTPGVK